jgi:DNA-binding winged helix-turn-helix (wHTH) protein
MRLQFDRFIIDFEQRRLAAGDEDLRLAPKTFNLLRLLIEARPRAVSKDEIFKQLWPEVFVTENNLATLISDLRTTLGDDPRSPQFIRTVYGFGYAFAGVATELAMETASPAPTQSGWKLVQQGREIPLQHGPNIVGRSGDGVIVLDFPTISRHHARVTITGDQASVEDLGSKNGTWVGTNAVSGVCALKNGDEVRLGSLVVVVRFSPGASTTETVARS